MAVSLVLLHHPHNTMTTELSALRARRVEFGLSLDELARRSGNERSRLSRAERGYLHLREDELVRIAEQLGVTSEQIKSK
jgi:transcriptional regulator with XRE-family HTH domain